MKIKRLKQVTHSFMPFILFNQKRKVYPFLSIALCMLCHIVLVGQALKPVSDDLVDKNYKSVNLVVGFGNSLLLDAKPAFLLSFEKNGLLGSNLFGADIKFEKLFNTGVYLEYRNDFLNTFGFGLRVALDPLEFINEFSTTKVNTADQLDVNAGVQWGYLLFFDEWLGTIGGFRNLNPYLNARYYFTKNIGIHAELGRTATYTNFNMGISLRF